METVSDNEGDAAALQTVIERSERIVFFGGAGVSTESGIPDFRSEAGLYHAQQTYGYRPEEILSAEFFATEPEVFFDYYRHNLVYPDAKPNPAHLALASLERAGKLAAIVTQNIDGLHQAAGSHTVWELHGSVWRNHCLACGRHWSLAAVLERLDSGQKIPLCQCGGTIKPDVVLYGESLPSDVLDAAARAVRRADTLIVGGTSLSVYPAAGLVRLFAGRDLVLINKTPTPADRDANVVLHEPIGQALAPYVTA